MRWLARWRVLRKRKNSSNPTLKVKSPDTVMFHQVPSWKCSAGIRQLSISKPSAIRTMPKNLRIYLMSLPFFIWRLLL